MHILVILRLVPDTLEELPLDESGLSIDRAYVGLKLNEFDDHALEEAVLLKEGGGATVTALGLSSDGIDRVLQTAVARGADRAVRLSVVGEPTQSRDLAHAVAKAVEALTPDLVLTGIQTSEDFFGQLVPFSGERLGWPHVSGVTSVTIAGPQAVRIHQEYGNGHGAILEVDLPAVIGVQAASKPPRYVSGSRLRQAIQGTRIEPLSVEAEGEPLRSAPTMVALQEPVRGPGAEMIDGSPEAVADRLVAVFEQRGFLRVSP